MDYKKIFIIDDKGDVVNSLSKEFENNQEIQITHSESDFNVLDETFDRFAYLMIINQDDLEIDLTELIHYIQDNMFYLTVPVVIVSSDEEIIENKDMMEIPIYNYIPKPLDMHSFRKFLEYLIEVCDYNKNINDISGLPGNRIIDAKIMSEINKKSDFAVVYIDLDNFKEFVEHYGLLEGSKVISMFANMLYEKVKLYGDLDDFIGHIGGDDFILVLKNYKLAEKISNEIIATFNEDIKEFYSKEELEKGYIEAVDRFGELDKIKIMGISIVIIDYTEFEGSTYDKVYKKMMQLKRKAKTVEGSTIITQ